jgi:phosphoglycerate-specific signal transduction histidine kinase
MDERVENLEKLAQTLAPLPAEVRQLSQRMVSVESRLGGVESQIVQLRTDMTDGFSAIRREVKDGLEQVRTEFREDIAGLGRDMAQGFLRVEDKTRTLFEEYVGRRTVIAEGHPAVDEPPRGA